MELPMSYKVKQQWVQVPPKEGLPGKFRGPSRKTNKTDTPKSYTGELMKQCSSQGEDPLSRDHGWALLLGEKERWGGSALCPAGKQRSKIMQLLFTLPQWASLDAVLIDNIHNCLWNHFVNAARYFPKRANNNYKNNNLKETLLAFLFRNCYS